MKIPRFLALAPAALLVAMAADQPANKTGHDRAESKTTARSKHWPRIRFGGLAVGAGYAHFSGNPYPYYGYYGFPYAAGYYPYFYDPFFFMPYAYPGFYSGYAYQPGMGRVKLQTRDAGAYVYLNGALAGEAGKLKSMWLDPGAYDLEVRSGNRKFTQRIYVLSGKTLKIAAAPTETSQ